MMRVVLFFSWFALVYCQQVIKIINADAAEVVVLPDGRRVNKLRGNVQLQVDKVFFRADTLDVLEGSWIKAQGNIECVINDTLFVRAGRAIYRYGVSTLEAWGNPLILRTPSWEITGRMLVYYLRENRIVLKPVEAVNIQHELRVWADSALYKLREGYAVLGCVAGLHDRFSFFADSMYLSGKDSVYLYKPLFVGVESDSLVCHEGAWWKQDYLRCIDGYAKLRSGAILAEVLIITPDSTLSRGCSRWWFHRLRVYSAGTPVIAYGDSVIRSFKGSLMVFEGGEDTIYVTAHSWVLKREAPGGKVRGVFKDSVIGWGDGIMFVAGEMLVFLQDSFFRFLWNDVFFRVGARVVYTPQLIFYGDTMKESTDTIVSRSHTVVYMPVNARCGDSSGIWVGFLSAPSFYGMMDGFSIKELVFEGNVNMAQLMLEKDSLISAVVKISGENLYLNFEGGPGGGIAEVRNGSVYKCDILGKMEIPGGRDVIEGAIRVWLEAPDLDVFIPGYCVRKLRMLGSF